MEALTCSFRCAFRLTKEPAKQHRNVQCDWDKWVDEDEEDEKPENDFGGGCCIRAQRSWMPPLRM
jgi:hypothetical protein